jgi:tetrahydromethanopterin S-methyltransferase subunit G
MIVSTNHIGMFGIALAALVGLIGVWVSAVGPEHVPAWVGMSLLIGALLSLLFGIAVLGHGIGWHTQLRRIRNNWRLRTPWERVEGTPDSTIQLVSEVKTNPYDVPKKLDAIDKSLSILRGELTTSINKGMQLATGGWWNALKANQGMDWQPYREELKTWRDDYKLIHERLDYIQKENDKYQDVLSLIEKTYTGNFIPAVDKFYIAIWSITGDTNKVNIALFVKPLADEFYKQLRALDAWKTETAQKALVLRRSLSQ